MGRVIIAFYDNFDSACEVIKALIDKGIRDNSISLVAHESACERTWSSSRAKLPGFFKQPLSMNLSGIGPVLILGYLVKTFCSNGSTQKSLVNILEMDMIPKVDAHAYTEGVRRRGVLVLVKADAAGSIRALNILEQSCPVDIQDLSNYWRKNGWTHFDETAKPLANRCLNWPSCITGLPGDGLLDNENLANWPQNMVNQWSNFNWWND